MTATASNAVVKAVVDTNVLVSGLHYGGKPRDVLDLLRAGGVQLCISLFILQELKTVLEEDFGWSNERVDEAVERLKAGAVLVEPRMKISAIKAKDDDNRILECAVAAGARFIISGDRRHLLPLREYEGIRILTPDEFLRLRIDRGC